LLDVNFDVGLNSDDEGWRMATSEVIEQSGQSGFFKHAGALRTPDNVIRRNS